ncbi:MULTISPECIES: dephospho-CoA kinase [Micrococcaceae]|uniref:dephospho-CoA kinase n=1 Tax=Micrococcaceae TaxID=1268 RepID=UPI00160A1D40|nr:MULTISPECIES: dephospho-CoA kinase [Micrococcaceae]MBB5748839.1 dephospho-CoA kinase [Micrococcus sp. TA1]HRO29110.1 dephospho-CoA kinase [Citricoccus sp.]HRO92776.1 dephospho-CoA kinase [Citricoccus sp.]
MTETPAQRPRLHIGLTGGIASGKSTVAAELADLGAVVVDADALARAVVAPGSEGLALVREAFGPAAIAADGTMDRAAVAALVFNDADARERLNGIIHPLVRSEGRRLVREAGPDAVVVQDVPLLVETGQAGAYDLVLVVQADLDERVARMVRDRGMTEEAARARIATQATDEQRRAAADVVIVNDAGLEDLRRATRRFWEEYVAPVLDGAGG